MIPKVMIILGSASDIKIAEKSIDILEKLKIPYSLKIASAHRTHEKVKKLVVESTNQGIEAFIGIAGLAAHLSGSIASYTHKPVIGVPVDVKLGGLDALLASSQMPFPSPVATVGIDRGDNGGIFAGQIIGINDEKVKKRVSKLRKAYHEKIHEDEKLLMDKLNGNYLNKDFIKNIYSTDFIEEKHDKPSLKEKSDEINLNRKLEEETLENSSCLVSIISGSYSDMKIAKKVAIILDRMKISHDINVVSPIRYPDKFQDYMKSMKEVKLFIAVTGLSAHVAGSIVALSEKPVIGVPCSVALNGMDSLLSMVNMPPGVPVGSVGIENGRNGGILAGEILSIADENIEYRLKRLKYQTAEL
jgi:5-(carboxyamino)imidazole ribonucleotide mutase